MAQAKKSASKRTPKKSAQKKAIIVQAHIKSGPKSGTKKYVSELKLMSLTDLQRQAKRHGIPFGGLTKSQIVDKIQKYIRY